MVLTNKRLSAARAIALHNGRGSQEGIFGELKSHNTMNYVPTRRWNGNQVYLLSALWEFEQLNTLRRRLIQQADRLIRPQRKLTLSMASNEATENGMLQILDATSRAA